MNAYTTSSSYTTFPIYDRSSGNLDPLSFYPPLFNDPKSGSSVNISQTVLKRQEQEIRSQLSPKFWDRLNEATKRATSNINLYDYNYSNYEVYGSLKKSQNLTSNNIFNKNGIISEKISSDGANKFFNDKFSNRLSNFNQIKSNDFSNLTSSKNLVTTISDNNRIISSDRTKRTNIEKSQTFVNMTSDNRIDSNENIINYFKSIQIGKPNLRTQTQTLSQPSSQVLLQNKPPNPQKPLSIFNKPAFSSFESNHGKNFGDNNQKLTPIRKKSQTYIESGMTDKLPSTMSTVNIPHIKQDFVQRSKTMNLNDNEKYSKSIGVDNMSSNLQNIQNKSNPVSNSKLKNFHKSLTIRSRINNFYKDFIDEKNAYLSSLTRTGSDINIKLSSSALAGKESDKVKVNVLDEYSNEKIEPDHLYSEDKNENSLSLDGILFYFGSCSFFFCLFN